jgi:hypothetical protein
MDAAGLRPNRKARVKALPLALAEDATRRLANRPSQG